MTTITQRIDNITRIPDAWLKAAPPAPHSVKIDLKRDVRGTVCEQCVAYS